MTRTITFVCLTLALLLLGCEGQETVIETSAPPRPALSQPGSEVTVKHTKSTLLSDSVELKRYEVASQALQSWYAVRGMRPALLLYSNDPFLQSVGGFC
jgi:hypothetical protein